ncbi:MAG: hypothetical protein GX643_09405 [Acidimicrobiales bacterium]|nr:hypothetical protein [Acidimicrobiales bacterium]
MSDYLVPVYATYLITTVVLCAWLARTLFRNGALFLQDVFPDRPEMAEAVNHLLVTGFAMVNVGYGFFMMKSDGAATSTEAFEVLAQKLGILLVSLAAVHFVNLYVFHKLGARRRQAELAPPVAPQRIVGATRGTFAPPPPPPPAGPVPGLGTAGAS